jgi:hypothetical protein
MAARMKTLRITLAVLLFLLLALFGALAVVATNVRAMEFTVQRVLQRLAPQVQSVRFGSMRYSFPSSWSIGRVSATVLSESGPVKLFVDRLELNDLSRLLPTGRTVRIELHGVESAFEQIRMCGGSCAVELSRTANGVVYAGRAGPVQVQQKQFRITEIRTEFSGDAKSLSVTNLSAAVYGGTLSGRAQIAFGPSAGYDAELAVQSVECGELEQALGGVFRELGGKLSGSLRIAGTGQQIDRFDTAWNMPGGGAVSAAMLASIIRYIPDSAQKKQLDFLIRTGAKLPVESFVFTLKNESPDRLSGIIGLKSRAANLELNVTHEIRVDARIDALIQAWQAVFNQEATE